MKNIKRSYQTLKLVFRKPEYIITGILVTLFLFLLAIWLPNLEFIGKTIFSDSYSLSEKIYLLWSMLGFIKTNFTAFSRIITILVVLLAGINVPVFIYYLHKRITIEKSIGTSFLGIISGMLGVGCAACGSVILSSIFGIGATSSFLGLFPFHGNEFGIIGIALLLWSTYKLLQKIDNPQVCTIKIK